MGNSSKESPKYIEGVDYHLVRVPANTLGPGSWIYASIEKTYAREVAVMALDSPKDYPAQQPRKWGRSVWVVCKGPAPSKKWGPVCP